VKRREFIAGLGGAAAAWPVVARGQQSERVRRVGILMATTSDEPDSQAQLAALHQGLQEAGWLVGTNVHLDVRWSGGDVTRLRKNATELVALDCDVIVAGVGPTGQALRNASRTVPVVFAQVVDPVGNGYVASLSRPGGNMTGFLQFEYSLSGKWFELLREIAPQVSRIGVIRDGEGGPAGIGLWAVIQAFASPLGVELSPIDLYVTGSAESAISAFTGAPNSGLIIVAGSLALIHRELIITLAAQHRLPAVYPYRSFVQAGGLISYGPNLIDQYRRTAGYVDRILKGEKPADLPVQAPTKYELAVNLKTAKALGITMPPSVLARADEVIE
jgi:putative ABC transport system substrate-binding protein